MTIPDIFVATWNDGVLVYQGDARRQELAGRGVRALASDRDGGVLAIVDGHAVCRRTGAEGWRTLAESPRDLACLVRVGEVIHVGTDDASVLRVTGEGTLEALPGFAVVPGRAAWYAGSAIIDGRRVGPPLGVRSLATTADQRTLLANVHVGGIPCSTDGGVTWQPTIAIDHDVHEVSAHPTEPGTVVAAAAVGLCLSRDGGRTWTVEREGLHASYCSAVAFCGDDILVSAAADHFAERGAVYRRPLHGSGPLQPVPGLPRWLAGIVDTGCLAVRGTTVAVADKGGNLHVSTDGGRSWRLRDQGLSGISWILVN